MSNCTNGTGIKLSGDWTLSGLVHQIESLSTLLHLECGLGETFHIDCSEISSVDMSGLQLLYAWMQCVSIRGVKPELANLPEGIQQAIKTVAALAPKTAEARIGNNCRTYGSWSGHLKVH